MCVCVCVECFLDRVFLCRLLSMCACISVCVCVCVECLLNSECSVVFVDCCTCVHEVKANQS